MMYSKFIDINPEFEQVLAEMSGAQKLSFLNMLDGMNGGVPPKGYLDDKTGNYVFKSDDHGDMAIFDPRKDDSGDYDIEIRTSDAGFFNVGAGIGDSGGELSIGGGVVKVGIAKIDLHSDGSASGLEGIYSGAKAGVSMDSSGIGGAIKFSEIEGKKWELSQPHGRLDSSGDLVIEQASAGIGGSVSLFSVGMKVGKGFEAKLGPVGGSIDLEKKTGLEDHLQDISPEDANRYTIEALEFRKNQLDKAPEYVPRPGSPEDHEKYHEGLVKDRAEIDALLEKAYEERSVYRIDAAKKGADEFNEAVFGEESEVTVPFAHEDDTLVNDRGLAAEEVEKVEDLHTDELLTVSDTADIESITADDAALQLLQNLESLRNAVNAI